MPSKAFFRCRSCGEPLRTEALRCPICGAAHPTAATPPFERTEQTGAVGDLHAAAALQDAARETAAALAQERSPVGAARREPKVEVPVGAPDDNGIASARRRVEPSLRSVEAPPRDAGDDRDANGAREDSTALVAPSRGDAGEAAPGSALTTAPGGPGRGRTVRRRARSLVGRLIRIAVMVLIIIGIIRAGEWWMRNNNLPDLGLDPAATSSGLANLAAHGDSTIVEAGGDWVPVLRDAADDTRGALIEANGPFRLRVDGRVYTLEGGRPVRLSLGSDSTVEVKAVRPPAKVEVTPIPAE